MIQRYLVTMEATRRHWVILDRHMYGYCTLPDDDSEYPNLLPLEWSSRAGAEHWLDRCYTAWRNELVPVPDNWQPYRLDASPWC